MQAPSLPLPSIAPLAPAAPAQAPDTAELQDDVAALLLQQEEAQSALEAILTDIGRTGLDVIDSYCALKVHLGALVHFRGATHTPLLSDAIVACVDTLINELCASITALEQAALPLPKLHNNMYAVAADI
ncbi:hypothetical protein DENSPDRAFT_854410 [Dentipellis sp. KUC8613]|nr:hypothetical protein DENSPDRAFT_854410 [Dentipellis sp. KUC8613]